MISFFRRIIGSKFGAAFAIAFLALIAFAFAAGDVSNTGGFGSLTSLGSDSTKIGSRNLPETAVRDRVQRIFEQQRRENPGLRIGDFLAEGAVEGIYDQMVAGIALKEFAAEQGVHVSKRMVDGEIASIPAFQDASGKFSQELFRQLLSGQGVSEDALREDIEQQVTGRMLLVPTGFGTRLSDSQVLPYASLLLEAREGKIAAIPSGLFAPTDKPTGKQLKDFYTSHADRFTVPEQRRLRYAVIDAERFATAATPTESEIAKYYADNRARYAARETRTVEQLILPGETAAKEAAKAASLVDAARANGLSVATLEGKTRDDLAKDTSRAAADAVFSAPQGQMAGPVKLSLGWALFQTRDVQKVPEKSLPQAKPEITEILRNQKHKTLLSDFLSKVEDEVANGATFDEAVKDNGLKVETSPLLLETGQSVEAENFTPSPDLGPLIKPAFGMDADDDAQIMPITQEQRYALLDVTEIVAAAPPPLDKVKPAVEQFYQLDQGAKKAKALANKLKGEIDKGKAFDKALAEAGSPLPPPQKIGGRRADLLRGDQRPPAEISILFAMAPGTIKILPIPQDRGYFLVMLDTIQQGDAAKVEGLVDRVRTDMVKVVASEYGDQFERAIERALDIERDPALLSRVTGELRRVNGGTVQ